MKTYIGIDLGTSGVKLVLTDSNGNILNEVSESYPVFSPNSGWSEQNPEDWFNAVIRGLKKLNSSQVACLACAGQMHGLVVIDDVGNVIHPCILWNDGRAYAETELLNGVIGERFLAENTGNIAFAGFTAPKLLWLKNNKPNIFERIYKIMLPKDYIVYRLTGQITTDFSDAGGTLLLDVENGCWSKKMLDICGISEGQLPQLCKSYDKIGTVKSEIAQMLGWGEVAVAAGAADNAAAALGTGAVENGCCNVSLGTSGTLFIATDKFVKPNNNALHSFAHANGGWHLMGCILSAASANKWWIEDILGSNYNLAEGARHLTGQNEVFFLPYLMGERCPHNDVSARGAFIGMTPDTTKEQMSLAVLEGVAFALRDCLEIAKNCGICVKQATICGGGSASPLWREIIANVLGAEIYTVESAQGPAVGAAVLSLTAGGEFENVNAAADKIVKKRLSAVPDSRIAEKYNFKYLKYGKLYYSLKEFFKMR